MYRLCNPGLTDRPVLYLLALQGYFARDGYLAPMLPESRGEHTNQACVCLSEMICRALSAEVQD